MFVLWTVLASTDGIDGWIARRHGTTRSGAFLDPLADKVLVLGALFSLASIGRFAWLPVAIIAVREVGISLYRVYWGRRGLAVPASRGGKLKTLLQGLAVGAAVMPPLAAAHQWVGNALLWASVVVAVLSGRSTCRRAGGGHHHAGRQRRRAARAEPRPLDRPSIPRGTDRMRCEVVAVGTELLLGQIVDTNSSWIGEQLALAGIDSYFQTKVGDNAARIADALRTALDRSDAVLVCGGLGPTQDDITRDVIAEVMGVELATDPGDRGAHPAHVRLAGSRHAGQQPAPGHGARGGAHHGPAAGHRARPGLPDRRPRRRPGHLRRAGRALRDEGDGRGHGHPRPAAPGRGQAVIRSRTLRTWGQSESGLAEMLAERIDELDQPGHATIAFLASGIEGLKVRVTAKAATDGRGRPGPGRRGRPAASRSSATSCSASTTSRWRWSCSTCCASRGLTLGCAESVTGGLIASRLTDVAGASDVFRGLGRVLRQRGEVRRARRARRPGGVRRRGHGHGRGRLPGARLRRGRRVTGVAGPDTQEGVPAGTVYLGLCLDGEAEATMIRLPGDRARVRQFSTISVLDWLRRRLLAGGAERGRGVG